MGIKDILLDDEFHLAEGLRDSFHIDRINETPLGQNEYTLDDSISLFSENDFRSLRSLPHVFEKLDSIGKLLVGRNPLLQDASTFAESFFALKKREVEMRQAFPYVGSSTCKHKETPIGTKVIYCARPELNCVSRGDNIPYASGNGICGRAYQCRRR